jgi:hypothetical protein
VGHGAPEGRRLNLGSFELGAPDPIYLKNEFRAKKKFRLSRGVAVGFWAKFVAQLAQPC